MSLLTCLCFALIATFQGDLKGIPEGIRSLAVNVVLTECYQTFNEIICSLLNTFHLGRAVELIKLCPFYETRN